MTIKLHIKTGFHSALGAVVIGFIIVSPAFAGDRVVVDMVLHEQQQQLGRIVLTDIAGGGISIDPLLKGLPAGDHMLVIQSAPDCGMKPAVGEHFNPVTSGVYHDRDEAGHMVVQSSNQASRLAAANSAFIQRLNAEPENVQDLDAVPLASLYSRDETKLALGDLPDLLVDQHGHATLVSYAPIISVAQLYGRSLIIKQRVGQEQHVIACGSIDFPSRP